METINSLTVDYESRTFQSTVLRVARDICRTLTSWNKHINHTIIDIEYYQGHYDTDEFDEWSKQLYEEVYGYLNGVKASKYFWYKELVYVKTKPGRILFSDCTMRESVPGKNAGDKVPNIELDYVNMEYIFYKKEFDWRDCYHVSLVM